MLSGDTKTCPACAETVRADAVTCRFCGHDLTRPDGTPTPATRRRGIGCGGAIFVAILLLVLIIKFGSDMPQDKAAPAGAAQQREAL